MKLQLSCPGKVFLIGEYGVVNGGSSLLASVGPRFEMSVKEKGSGQAFGIHAESPAGKFLKIANKFFTDWDIEFRDPYDGRGGFGASSAQYLLVNICARILKKGEPFQNLNPAHFSIQEIWNTYQASETVSGEGLRPSGADIVSQYSGHFTEFQKEPFTIKKHEWAMPDIEVAFVHTGKKVATHEHLASLRRIETSELEYLTREGIDAFVSGNEERFFDCIRDYHAELLEQKLVAEHTRDLIAALYSKSFVLAAKGSGALGSDLLTIYFEKSNLPQVKKSIESMGLVISATLQNLDRGLEIQSDKQGKVKGRSTRSEAGQS